VTSQLASIIGECEPFDLGAAKIDADPHVIRLKADTTCH
jgi:hypothetical protein